MTFDSHLSNILNQADWYRITIRHSMYRYFKAVDLTVEMREKLVTAIL